MSDALPAPERVRDRAAAAADRAATTADRESRTASLDLLVAPLGGERTESAAAKPVDPGAVERTDDGYAGPGAGHLGRLAAAARVAGEDARLHYPEPTVDADGPWLVVEPLDGRVATVHGGTGRVVVSAACDDASDPGRLDAVGDRVSAVLDAARVDHEHYPVAEDDRGVFTAGLTTLALESVTTADDAVKVTFSASTTPATTAASVAGRFGALDAEVSYEPVVGVERSSPDPALRAAVEDAHRETVGDCEYEWVPEPTAFSRLPTANKVALGTGRPGADAFTDEEYADCVELLERCVRRWGERR